MRSLVLEKDITNFREVSAVLVGMVGLSSPQGQMEPTATVWVVKRMAKSKGTAASVEARWKWALDREESHGDVIGFYHSHPPGATEMSLRDMDTMSQWSEVLGRDTLCVIECDGLLKAWRIGVTSSGVKTHSLEICRLGSQYVMRDNFPWSPSA